MAYPLSSALGAVGTAIGGPAGGVLGAAAGAILGGSNVGTTEVLAVGKKYAVKRNLRTGKIYAVRLGAHRRYAPRSRGTKMENLMYMAIMAKMFH